METDTNNPFIIHVADFSGLRIGLPLINSRGERARERAFDGNSLWFNAIRSIGLGSVVGLYCVAKDLDDDIGNYALNPSKRLHF